MLRDFCSCWAWSNLNVKIKTSWTKEIYSFIASRCWFKCQYMSTLLRCPTLAKYPPTNSIDNALNNFITHYRHIADYIRRFLKADFQSRKPHQAVVKDSEILAKLLSAFDARYISSTTKWWWKRFTIARKIIQSARSIFRLHRVNGVHHTNIIKWRNGQSFLTFSLRSQNMRSENLLQSVDRNYLNSVWLFANITSK